MKERKKNWCLIEKSIIWYWPEFPLLAILLAMVLHSQPSHHTRDRCTIQHIFSHVLVWPLAIEIAPPMVYRALFSICKQTRIATNKKKMINTIEKSIMSCFHRFKWWWYNNQIYLKVFASFSMHLFCSLNSWMCFVIPWVLIIRSPGNAERPTSIYGMEWKNTNFTRHAYVIDKSKYKTNDDLIQFKHTRYVHS